MATQTTQVPDAVSRIRQARAQVDDANRIAIQAETQANAAKQELARTVQELRAAGITGTSHEEIMRQLEQAITTADAELVTATRALADATQNYQAARSAQ